MDCFVKNPERKGEPETCPFLLSGSRLIDILPSPEGERDSHLRKWDLPGSLKPALHGTIRVWSHVLLPQALLPASPAVDAESFTPRLTRTSVPYAHVIVKRFGLGSGFTRSLPQTRTRLSSRSLNGAGLPGSMDNLWRLKNKNLTLKK